MTNLWLIFLTGLTTGGVSCAAMQGGLLAGLIATQKAQDETVGELNQKSRQALTTWDKSDWLPVGMFLLAKLVAHTLLGLLLGALGSVMTLSLEVRLAFQVFAALFMFATAMNLLDVHPIFRYVVFQPPKFIQRLIRRHTRNPHLFAPAFLGVMTLFIPCGVTQAMEVAAINSGQPLMGALIMFSFVLGTTPVFATIGLMTAKLSEKWSQQFLRVAAYALILMAAYSLNGVAEVLDLPITATKFRQAMSSQPRTAVNPARPNTTAVSDPFVKVENGVQKVTIGIQNHGYWPNKFSVKAGQPVELTLKSTEVYSCAAAFTFKKFAISTFLEANDQKVFTFTPTEKGKFTFACSMGMYTGVMEVI